MFGEGRFGRARNWIAMLLCNLILNTVATRPYRLFIEGSIAYGMRAAARDHREGYPMPGDWHTYEEHA